MTAHIGAFHDGTTVLRRARRRWRIRPALGRAATLLLSVWVLAVVLATSPHLVHHVFDPDDGADCPFLTAAHHAPGIAAAPIVLLALLPALDAAAVLPVAAWPRLRPARPFSRSPPAAVVLASNSLTR